MPPPQIIPIDLGRQAFDVAKPLKEWCLIERVNHNNTYLVGDGAYFRCIGEFIQKAILPTEE